MSNFIVELAQQHLQSGERQEAQNLLQGVLRADPDNLAAWEVLAKAVDDPRKQLDCYRQVLRLDPDNQSAKARVDELSGDRPHLPPPEVQEVVNLLRVVGPSALDAETVQEFSARGVIIKEVDGYISISARGREVTLHPSSLPPGVACFDAAAILRQAGTPLSPDERFNCPACDAVISRSDLRCPWCSVDLSGYQNKYLE